MSNTVQLSEAIADLQNALSRRGMTVRRGELLSRHTSFGIGGPAEAFVEVRQIDDLIEAVRVAHQLAVPWIVLGAGTNVLISDLGVRGLVIRNACTAVRYGGGEGDRAPVVCAETGIALRNLVRRLNRKGLGDLSWAEGIPGTLGGAVINNAGAFGGTMAQVIEKVEWIDGSGWRGEWQVEDLEMGYHTSRLRRMSPLNRPLLIKAFLRLKPMDPTELQERSRQFAETRRVRQPKGASAGSVFRNPPGFAAGRLIEEAGLKGLREGGAIISPKHGNFILNQRGALASDVYKLIRRAQREVWDQFGIRLEPEIELIGEFTFEDDESF